MAKSAAGKHRRENVGVGSPIPTPIHAREIAWIMIQAKESVSGKHRTGKVDGGKHWTEKIGAEEDRSGEKSDGYWMAAAEEGLRGGSWHVAGDRRRRRWWWRCDFSSMSSGGVRKSCVAAATLPEQVTPLNFLSLQRFRSMGD